MVADLRNHQMPYRHQQRRVSTASDDYDGEAINYVHHELGRSAISRPLSALINGNDEVNPQLKKKKSVVMNPDQLEEQRLYKPKSRGLTNAEWNRIEQSATRSRSMSKQSSSKSLAADASWVSWRNFFSFNLFDTCQAPKMARRYEAMPIYA